MLGMNGPGLGQSFFTDSWKKNVNEIIIFKFRFLKELKV